MHQANRATTGWAVRTPLLAALALTVMLGGAVVAPRSSGHAGAPQAEPDSQAQSGGTIEPSGFSPAQLQAAYGLSTAPNAGAGQTIAIVDSFDDPGIAADLAAFDATFDLPACPASCFSRVDQAGGTDYPATAPTNWGLEIAMDVEWAHAIAPGAHILLVEAASASLGDLLVAERYAGAHASYVSNSWGYPEFAGETADAASFAGPGVSYFAAVADSPGRTQYPATAPNVIAVGGDEPTATGTIPWTSGGGGCSAYEQAPAGLAGIATAAGCSGNQPTPAVSADAVNIPVLGRQLHVDERGRDQLRHRPVGRRRRRFRSGADQPGHCGGVDPAAGNRGGHPAQDGTGRPRGHPAHGRGVLRHGLRDDRRHDLAVRADRAAASPRRGSVGRHRLFRGATSERGGWRQR